MKGHKWFAAIYDKMLASEEKKFLGVIRAEMLKDVTGNVLEIGAGTGVNFQYYQPGAHVTATEPDPYMLERAKKRASEAKVAIELRQVAAEELPFPAASFDFVIDTLVLCSVSDPRKVLSEIKRVLKLGGELRLYEHVRYKNPIGALSQDLISPAWQWFGAGCHPNRNTERYLREAGFELSDVRIRKELPPIPPMIFTRPHLQAVARRPM
ncbi:MAG TPA: class I SAM-dependent methyltransferase [Dehalococcoidia bacterium]